MKYILVGVLITLCFFLLTGIVTGLIQNVFFMRMTEVTIIDYFFLVSSSVLIGVFFGLHFYSRKNDKNVYAVTGGTIFSFFAFACPICNVLLVSVVGVYAVATFIDPLRPLFGLVGISILIYVILLKYWQHRRFCQTHEISDSILYRGCKNCVKRERVDEKN